MNNNIQWEKIREPFPAKDIEWRIAQKGVGSNGKPWAKVLAYLTNRAIMQRLDDVVGPGNWRNEFKHLEKAFLCGISIKVGDEWVTKWDGAQESQIEATKGGLSGAMKRAAVQWGIGRYLYDLTEGWADICDNGANYVGKDDKNNVPAFKWNPPKLPTWALPSSANGSNQVAPQQPQAPKIDPELVKAKDRIKKRLAECQVLDAVFDVLAEEETCIAMLPDSWQKGLDDLADQVKKRLTP